MKRKTRKILIVLVKFAIAGSLLYWVARDVKWSDFWETLVSAKLLPLGAAVGLFVTPVLVLAVRWWYLLRILRIRIPLREAIRLTFLGTFFNYVIPGTVSGDLVKAYYVAKHTERKAAVLVSVFTDRVVGLLQFAILPAIVMSAMFIAGRGDVQLLRDPIIAVIVVFVGVTVVMSLMFSPTLRRRLGLARLLKRLPLQDHLSVAGKAAALYRRRFSALLRALAMTFGGQMCFIGAITLVGISLGLPVLWYQYFLYVPLIYIIASVPISPGGIGVAETLYKSFFVAAGAASSEVLALALVARLTPMIISLPGLWFALRGPSLPDAEQMQAELAAAAEGDEVQLNDQPLS